MDENTAVVLLGVVFAAMFVGLFYVYMKYKDK